MPPDLAINLSDVYDSLPIALCIIDREGRLVAANNLHSTLAGSSVDTLIGARVTDVSEEGGRNIERDFAHFDRGQSVPNHEITIRDRHYMVSVSPLRDPHGKVIAITVAHFDITEKKASEHKIARLNSRLRQMTILDHLTNTFNRRHFDDLFRIRCNWLRQSDRNFSFILFDLDYFKAYNDIYGHIEGDNCLRAVAGAARRVLRRTEASLSRYGGEEFAVLVDHPEPSVGEMVAERIRSSLHRLGRSHEAGIGKVVTVSCGVVNSTAIARPLTPDFPTRLMRLVDGALYQAKNAGRDRVYRHRP